MCEEVAQPMSKQFQKNSNLDENLWPTGSRMAALELLQRCMYNFPSGDCAMFISTFFWVLFFFVLCSVVFFFLSQHEMVCQQITLQTLKIKCESFSINQSSLYTKVEFTV